MIRVRRLLPALALALLLGVPAASTASATSPPLHVAQQSDAVSLEEAAAQVRAQTGGRILSAETRGRGANRVHRIKVLTDNNRVRIIQVDPRTGGIR